MSEVVYLFGAGASYGQRPISIQTKEVIPGHIERGLPIVSELESAIAWYCSTIEEIDLSARSGVSQKYPILIKELRWLQSMCHIYPTIDTYAKKLMVTNNDLELNRLKNALATFFTLIQSFDKRDLRYDSFVSSIILDNGSLPNNVSILSWNYDYQLEYVLQDFSYLRCDLISIWHKYHLSRKGGTCYIDNSKFNCVKLNGTALFSSTKNNELLDPSKFNEAKIETLYQDDLSSIRNNISFAWERDDDFIERILPIVQDTKTLVVIGYSFPYVNRVVDRKLINNMNSLRSVYIQDTMALDVKQSFEFLLNEEQLKGVSRHIIHIHPRTSVTQFIIPKEL